MPGNGTKEQQRRVLAPTMAPVSQVRKLRHGDIKILAHLQQVRHGREFKRWLPDSTALLTSGQPSKARDPCLPGGNSSKHQQFSRVGSPRSLEVGALGPGVGQAGSLLQTSWCPPPPVRGCLVPGISPHTPSASPLPPSAADLVSHSRKTIESLRSASGSTRLSHPHPAPAPTRSASLILLHDTTTHAPTATHCHQALEPSPLLHSRTRSGKSLHALPRVLNLALSTRAFPPVCKLTDPCISHKPT